MKLTINADCNWKGNATVAEAAILSLKPDEIISSGTAVVRNLLRNIMKKNIVPVVIFRPGTSLGDCLTDEHHEALLAEMNPDIYVGLHPNITSSKYCVKNLKRAFDAGKTVYIHNGKEMKNYTDYFPVVP